VTNYRIGSRHEGTKLRRYSREFVTDVKTALRKANQLKINYEAIAGKE